MQCPLKWQKHVCVCVQGWAHWAQSALPFFTPVGKTPMSKTWLNGCMSLSLSLSASPSIADSLALSPMWAQRTLLRATKSSLFASQAREPLAPSPSLERRPRDTNRTWHPEREGWGGGGKIYSLSAPLFLTPLPCLSVSSSLGRPTAAEWWGRDRHWHRVCDTQWLMVKTFERGIWPQFGDLCNHALVRYTFTGMSLLLFGSLDFSFELPVLVANSN